ncbi:MULTISPECIES: D-alanyl-D-alanine carboxypeptidase/D-alanyl-D-alanine-endopeptidase [unclassified Janthinobacterium]|uniref:D-alanyl-D-alanine carboxypeptidase/D-alanyl-D-alanine endopeptidase n=1 Tax=unclassified Janthinobacterium TaxID=2610881 RepID=UPI000C16D2D3|nr:MULTISPECIES: D-alanyl-D-alanine carboxypeptidase/D-alanyl-D-alanine-endopeptidase [unclassified Janthinobacterium]MDN2680678.1 D-alanyl-D-alanine carboxypeptidase/D-alanyl-D-alanine-endopeptidase [Janthinobacterium sp. SUN033]MDO8069689.1 D-alanyl-D-alanine carboxypeptidase/D-alanyl-D-alanine-endopeptidase [Janthinobacterium sp. SUN206]PIF10772.1 D-alanyl-D-alanine carboxypeptidase/D-alanyl-D-alanine-endopeptidase (penicillin-binding protein 4) [Janthinobacterium sp. 13]
MLRPVLMAALLAGLGLSTAHAQLPESVSLLLRSANIPEDAMGAIVLRGNTTVLSHGAERSMQPASTMKLVTTAVGLEQLGPIFRGRTELRTSADVINGVLKGDLILRGGADTDFNADVLAHMLQTLRNQGIVKIKGDLILDRQLFQPARPDIGAAPFDESAEFRYNVIPDALLLNTNLIDINISATERQLSFQMQPPLENVSITSDMKLVKGSCAKWEDGWRPPEYRRDASGKLQVILHGTFPQNCSKATSINVLDRNDYADRLFRATWKRLGGTITGTVREAPGTGLPPTAEPVGTRMLADHVARALPEVLRDINKTSDNTLARTLFLSLGSLQSDGWLGSRPVAMAAPEDTASRARQVIQEWFQRHHIDTQGMLVDNGSGLSRTGRIAPAQMAGVLQAMQQSPWAPEFQSSLPIVALDGTMRKRLLNSPAAARARIKTGTLKNVVAIAGYVPDANNQQCVVVAMINSDLVGNGNGRAAVDALIEWVARSGATPAVAGQ